jgi:hypothetical protein
MAMDKISGQTHEQTIMGGAPGSGFFRVKYANRTYEAPISMHARRIRWFYLQQYARDT